MPNQITQALEALKTARKYIEGAYECAFPYEDENAAALRDVDAAIAALESSAPSAASIPSDFITHKDAWRKALVIARDQAEVSQPDIDDSAYWGHELRAYDLAHAELAAAPTAAAEPVTWAVYGFTAGQRIFEDMAPGRFPVYRPTVAAPPAPQPTEAETSAEKAEAEMLAVIDERDNREEVINAILDEVLGLDRHEWSSAYGFADAVEDVKRRMHAIEREHSGLESEIEDLRGESWPDWANQVLKIVRASSGYDGYDDADGVDIPGEVQELADEYSRTFKAMETFRKERDEARAALQAPASAPVAEPVALTEKQRRVLEHYNFAQFDADNLAKVPEAVRRDLWAMLNEMSATPGPNSNDK